MYFNPRAPCGARLRHMLREKAPRNFNPRAPCGARPPRGATSRRLADISIHAPRVGRDNGRLNPSKGMKRFQSTRPVWGATIASRIVSRSPVFQSTRPVWGATWRTEAWAGTLVFQSTRPVWGATRIYINAEEMIEISIHAPRVGRDVNFGFVYGMGWKFQSTRPVWGATESTRYCNYSKGFQSTRPVWGATPRCGQSIDFDSISIHAPRVGRDSKFDDFTPSNLHKRYKRVLARPKNTREKGKIKQKLAYIHAFSAFLGCEGSGTFCALVLRTQYR